MLVDGVPHGLQCRGIAVPRAPGRKPREASLWVNIKDLWYHPIGAIPDPVLHHGSLNAVVLPAVLTEMGLHERLIPELAVAATKDQSAETNPRRASASDYEALFREARG